MSTHSSRDAAVPYLILVGPALTAEHQAAAVALATAHGLSVVDAGPGSGPSLAVQVSGDLSDADRAAFASACCELASAHGIEVFYLADSRIRQDGRLICFDMDSTLIQVEVIDELAKVAGVGDQVSAITESAMRGEIDFAESFRRRVGLLEGMPESALAEVAARLPLSDGAEALCRTLKAHGYRLVILSGGFTYFGAVLQQRLSIDDVVANQLEIVDGACTGRHLGPIIDATAKAENLKRFAAEMELQPHQVVAVGDGANDLQMLAAAGLGVAFHAKPVVREQAAHAINSLGLDALLPVLG